MPNDLLLKTGKCGSLFSQPTPSLAIYLKVLCFSIYSSDVSDGPQLTSKLFKSQYYHSTGNIMQCSPKAKRRNSIKHTCTLLLTLTARVVKSWVTLTVSTENGTNKHRICCSRHWLRWQGQWFTAHDFTAMQLWDSSAMQLLTGVILFHIAHKAISKFVSWIFVLLGLFTSFTETTLHITQIKQWNTDRLHESSRVIASLHFFPQFLNLKTTRGQLILILHLICSHCFFVNTEYYTELCLTPVTEHIHCLSWASKAENCDRRSTHSRHRGSQRVTT